MSKILLMNNGYPTKGNPKHSSYIKRINNSLIKGGHKVDLLVLDSNFFNKFSHFIKYLKFYIKILNFNFIKYDYIFLHHYGHYALPLFLKIYNKKNIIIHWHGEDLFPNKALFNFVFNFFISKLPSTTRHIVPSYYFKKELMDKYKFNSDLISISPSGGIDTNLFLPKYELHGENIVRLGFASGLSFGKGADFLLLLLNDRSQLEETINKKIFIEFINYGNEKNMFYPVLCSHNNVYSWSPMDTNSMVSFYNKIDILIFPTRRKQESLGLVSLEAMSCGIPVLGPSCFAVPEYIIPGISGELFEFNNYDDFLLQLKKVIKNMQNYSPRNIILSNYSQSSVSNFYKEFFN